MDDAAMTGPGAAFGSVSAPLRSSCETGSTSAKLSTVVQSILASRRPLSIAPCSKPCRQSLPPALPTGSYASINKKLVVVPEEAETVQLIFQRYLEVGSVRVLMEDLDRRGIRTRRQILSVE